MTYAYEQADGIPGSRASAAINNLAKLGDRSGV